MPDEALTNAIHEFHAAQEDIARIETQIARLQENKAKAAERLERARQFVISWHEFAGKPRPEELLGVEATSAHLDIKPSNLSPRVTNPKKETVAAAAMDLIREREKPIPRPELHELLKQHGLDVRGGDPLVTLSTMLWRAGPKAGLIHLKGFGYWDGVQPYEPAGYIPGKPESDTDEPPPEYDPDLEYDARREMEEERMQKAPR